MQETKTKITISLVSWNGARFLRKCLLSVLHQTFKDYHLIVMDNNSLDNSVEIINEYLPLFGPKASFIQNKENLGFAKSHNQAFLWSKSDYVLCLNQDVVLEENFLEEAIKFLDEHPEVGSVTPKILRWALEESNELQASEKTNTIDSLGLKLFKNQRVVDIAAGEEDMGKHDQVKEIFGVSGAVPVYSRKALETVAYIKKNNYKEYFDEDFFSYKEDVDLAYRLKWKGWKAFFVPACKAYHHRSARNKDKNKGNLKEFIKERRKKTSFINFHSYKNHLFLIYKNLSSKIFLKYFFSIFFYEIKKLIYIVFVERTSLKGLSDFFKKKKIMKQKRKQIMKTRNVSNNEITKWYN